MAVDERLRFALDPEPTSMVRVWALWSLLALDEEATVG